MTIVGTLTYAVTGAVDGNPRLPAGAVTLTVVELARPDRTGNWCLFCWYSPGCDCELHLGDEGPIADLGLHRRCYERSLRERAERSPLPGDPIPQPAAQP